MWYGVEVRYGGMEVRYGECLLLSAGDLSQRQIPLACFGVKVLVFRVEGLEFELRGGCDVSGGGRRE